MNKKLIVSLFFIIVLIVFGIVCFFIDNREEDNLIEKKSVNDVIESRTIELINVSEENDSFIVKNFKLDINSNINVLEGVFISKEIEEIISLNLEIILYDKNNNEIEKFNFELQNVLFDEERDIFCQVNGDLSSAYSFNVNIIK